MERIDLKDLEGNRAYAYMDSLGALPLYPWDHDAVAAAIAVRARAAMKRGFYPLQDVLRAAMGMYQRELSRHDGADVRDVQLPDVIARPFAVRAALYDPSPVDTAHVVPDDAMRAAAPKAAEALYGAAREGSKDVGEVYNVAWAELGAADKQPFLDIAEDSLKVLAAGGGVMGGTLEFEQEWDATLGLLNEHLHARIAKAEKDRGVRFGVERATDAAGRPVRDPNLLPLEDLSAEECAKVNAKNAAVLRTLLEEDINIAPQLSPKVKETEQWLEGVRKERAKERAKDGRYAVLDKSLPLTSLSRDRLETDVVRPLAEAALWRDAAERGAKEVMPGPEMFKEVIEKMGPLTEDLVTEDGIIPRGAEPFVEFDGSVTVKELRFDGTEAEITPSRELLDRIVRSGLSQGMTVLPLEKTQEHLPLTLDTLANRKVAVKYVTDARHALDAFLADGFVVTEPEKNVLSLTLDDDELLADAVKERFPEHAGILSILERKRCHVAYMGPDEDIAAAFKDALSQHYADKFGEKADVVLANFASRRMEWNPGTHRTAEDVRSGLTAFAERLQDKGSEEHIIMRAAQEEHNGMPLPPQEIMKVAYMNLSGCSYNDATLAVEKGQPSLVLADAAAMIRRSLDAYRKGLVEYMSRGRVARAFTQKPALPPVAEQAPYRLRDIRAKMQEVLDVAAAVRGVTGAVRGDDGRLAFDDNAVTKQTEKLLSAYRDLGTRLFEGVRGIPGLDAQRTEMESMLKALPSLQEPVLDRDRLLGVFARLGVSREWSEAAYEEMAKGEQVRLSCEIKLSDGRMKAVHANVGFDKQGTLMLYNPSTRAEIGPLKTVIRGPQDLDFSKGNDKGAKMKPYKQGRYKEIAQKEADERHNKHHK